MKQFKHIISAIFFLAAMKCARGQDPSYSQFFSSPLNINPALTANVNGDWRLIANCRDQWLRPASPYATGTISYDSKILKTKVPEGNYMGLGGMLMYDQAMMGVLKSSYASINASYNVKLAETDDGADHRLGMGAGITYAHQQVDYSKLDFSNQFTGFGFDTNLPTGEAALTNMKPYLSANLGMLYSYISDYSNIDIGVAGYHLNKPKQTVTNDPKQYLPARYVAHGNFGVFLNDKVVLNTNAIYQTQSGTRYFSIGGSLGYYLSNDGEDDVIINGGVWYWSKNAVIPYLGLVYQNFQFGLTYDITVSKLSQASSKPTTIELSLILRSKEKIKNIIPCPWK
jgi:type IX secretion system PorP/SprF family membrane protein